MSSSPGSVFSLGLWKTDGALTFLPLAALLEEFDAFEALEHGTFARCGTGSFERVVLGHGGGPFWWRGAEIRGERGIWQEFWIGRVEKPDL